MAKKENKKPTLHFSGDSNLKNLEKRANVEKKKPTLQQKQQEHKNNIALQVFAGIGVLAFLGMGMMMHTANKSSQALEVATATNTGKYRDLTNQYNKLNHQFIVDPDSGQVELVSATKAGDKLANLQNEYSTAKTTRQIKAIKHKILPLLASTDDDTAPWLISGKSKKNKGTWRFESRFNFSQSRMTVIFTNTNDQGQLLAYATAVYIPSKKQFTKIDVVNTMQGLSNAPVTNDSKEDLEKYNKKVKKAIDSEPKPSKKEMEEDRKARQKQADKEAKSKAYQKAVDKDYNALKNAN